MTVRSTGAGIAVALLSASAFATSGPFAKALLQAGWTPGGVVLLRIAGAAALLSWPAWRGLHGRLHLLRRGWRQVVAYGVLAVAVPQLAFFNAVSHLSVGVALLLEYLGLVLVVGWQAVAARRLPPRHTVLGIVLALAGLVLVLDVLGGVRLSLVGVAWGGVAALGLAAYFLLSGQVHEEALPPLGLAGAGLVVGGLTLGALGAGGALPMRFAGSSVALLGGTVPWWLPVLVLAVVAGAVAYVTGIAAARALGAKLASFVGLSEVLFAVLFAWALLGELPGPSQLLGGLLILAGVVVVRSEERSEGRARERATSQTETGPVLGATPLGDLAEVPDQPIECGGVDIAAVQVHRAAVGSVEQQ